MPSNQEFSFEIHVGDTPIAEYEKNGKYYVECNLYTPVSYKQALSETVNGEVETQSWPVTPYEIKVTAHPDCSSTFYYRVFVDGMKVKGVSLEPGDSRFVKGFRDGTVVRELLFSMPRFAQNEEDRLTEERVSHVGMIEIECWHAVLQTSEWKIRHKNLDFTQANKKDAYSVTKGEFTMATSKAGRIINPHSEYRCVDQWKRSFLKSKLSVSYRMSSELRDMGFNLREMNIQARQLPSRELNHRSADVGTEHISTGGKKRKDASRQESNRETPAAVSSQNKRKKSAGNSDTVKEITEVETLSKSGTKRNSRGSTSRVFVEKTDPISNKSLTDFEIKTEVDEDKFPEASVRNKPSEDSDDKMIVIDLTSDDEDGIVLVEIENGNENDVVDLVSEAVKCRNDSVQKHQNESRNISEAVSNNVSLNLSSKSKSTELAEKNVRSVNEESKTAGMSESKTDDDVKVSKRKDDDDVNKPKEEEDTDEKRESVDVKDDKVDKVSEKIETSSSKVNQDRDVADCVETHSETVQDIETVDDLVKKNSEIISEDSDNNVIDNIADCKTNNDVIQMDDVMHLRTSVAEKESLIMEDILDEGLDCENSRELLDDRSQLSDDELLKDFIYSHRDAGGRDAENVLDSSAEFINCTDNVEASAAIDTPTAVETSVVVKVPMVVEAAMDVEAPVTIEAPVAIGGPVTIQTPVAIEAHVAIEEPTVLEAPVILEAPMAVAPMALEALRALEAPMVKEAPMVIEASVAIEASTAIGTPVAIRASTESSILEDEAERKGMQETSVSNSMEENVEAAERCHDGVEPAECCHDDVEAVVDSTDHIFHHDESVIASEPAVIVELSAKPSDLSNLCCKVSNPADEKHVSSNEEDDSVASAEHLTDNDAVEGDLIPCEMISEAVEAQLTDSSEV